MIRKDRYIQYPDRVIIIVTSRFSRQFIPSSSQIHAEFMQFSRMINLRTHIFNREMFAQFSQQLLFGQTVQIFYNAVVINDFQLMIREMNSHEEVIFFRTIVVRVL